MVISRVMIRVTPFRAHLTLLITNLLSPLPLQVLIKECQSKKLSEQTMEARIDEAETLVFQKRVV